MLIDEVQTVTHSPLMFPMQNFNEWTPEWKKKIIKTFSIFWSNLCNRYKILLHYCWFATSRVLYILYTTFNTTWSVLYLYIYIYRMFTLIIVYRSQMINGNGMQLIPNPSITCAAYLASRTIMHYWIVRIDKAAKLFSA